MAWKPSRILRSLTMRACSEASLAPRSACDLGAKLASLQARIVKERKILEGFQAMRNATSNQDGRPATEPTTAPARDWDTRQRTDIESVIVFTPSVG
jgi:hypothetical protein